MKTLSKNRLLRTFVVCCFLLFSADEFLSQCTVNAGPDATKCLNQPYNPGPFVTTSGTTGQVTYSWNGVSFSNSPNTSLAPTTTTTYTLTIQDASGCTATDQFTLTILPLPTVNAGNDFTICPGTPTQLCASATSPNGAITLYTWTSGPPSQCWNIAPTSQTTYTVTALDVAGCQKSDPITVFMFQPPAVSAGPNQSMCLSDGSIQLTGSPAGGTWSGSGITSSGLFTPSAGGTFTVTYTYTNSNGCTNSDAADIVVTNIGTVNGGSDLEFCEGELAYQMPAVGTWSGSTYVTSGGLFNPTQAGVYTLTVTAGASGCTIQDQVVVTVHDLPSVNAGSDAAICSGQTIQLTGSASSTNGAITSILWTGSNLSNTGIYNPMASPATATTYTLYVTDAENCSSSDAVVISVNANPTVNAGADINICANAGPQTLSGQSPAGGTWSGSGVNASGVFTPGSLGSFTLNYTFTNSNGCSASDQRIVTVINPGSVNAGNDVTLCLNSTPHQLTAGGTWTGSSWVSSGGLFTPGAVGIYTLTFTANTGQCFASDVIEVEVLPLPTINAGNDFAICSGEIAQLNATASSPNGAINAYTWTSGIVSNNLIANPSASPLSTSTYSVTATDAFGCSSGDAITVTVHSLPSVNAGNNITLCDQPIAYQLSGFSPIGGSWSGSGVNSTGLFTPSATGVQMLTYCYTDNNGCEACDDMSVNVVSTTYADAGPDITVCAGSPAFNLQAVSTGGTWTPNTYLNSSGLFNPAVAGTYICHYTLGSGSCMTTDQVTVTVNNLPVANAGPDGAVCAGDTYQLSGGGNGTGGIDYLWNNASLLDDPTISFPIASIPSTTVFTLTVSDANGCSDSDDVTITYTPLPDAQFSSPQNICVNALVNFNNQSTNASAYDWNFGNGNSSGQINGSTVFPAAGDYDVVLSAMNTLGCIDSIVHTIHVMDLPQASFTKSVNGGCSPLSVEFVNTSQGENLVSNWDFGNSSYTGTTPDAIAFAANGTVETHTITLTVINQCGSDNFQDQVVVDPQPIAQFSTDLSSICSPVTTVFLNTSLGNPDYFLWDLGDGETSSDAVPAPKVYTTDDDEEEFIIQLAAFNECGGDSASSIVLVLPNTVHVNLQPSVPVGCSPLFVEFNNYTTGASQYHFDFGDGDESQLVSPNHIYSEPGEYQVFFEATDGCSYGSDSLVITVLPSPQISITSDLSDVCPLQDVHFNASTTGNISNIGWDFGDGQYASDEDPVHQYAEGNLYFVSATAQDANGCNATASMQFEVYPQPHASFTLAETDGCSPLNICPENTSTGASSYSWDFDNGFTSNAFTACQDYLNFSEAANAYTISLEVSNEFNCTDRSEQMILVQPQPNASFELSSDNSCIPNQEVEVIVNGAGASAFDWYTDGELQSAETNPSFFFSEAGDHTIRMVAFNAIGCTNEDVQIYTIHPVPVINFLPDAFEGCAPLTVRFENNSDFDSEWHWSFGNGASSILESPEVTFATPGAYDVQLIATSPFGCTSVEHFDEMIEVHVLPEADFVFTPDDDIIYELDIEFENLSSGAQQYFWDFGDGFASTELNPVHHYNRGGYYYVTLVAQNEHGCQAETTKAVNIDDTFYVFVPNSFTPDDDGVNDVFQPVFSSTEEIRKYEFSVINRWGEEIFRTDDPKAVWMGNVRDGEHYTHNDTFTWVIRIEFNNMQTNKTFSGSVTVLR